MNTARMTTATDSEGYTHIVGENYTASYTVFDGEDAIYVERIDVDAWDDNETLANRLDMWTLDQGYGVFVIY